MMTLRLHSTLPTFLLAGLLCATGCSKEPTDRKLTVVFSNNMAGEIRSCGCAAQDYGGLGRRASFLDAAKRTSGEVLLLEAGDLFGKGVNYEQQKANLTLQALAYMQYNGIALGEQDFTFGADYLIERVDALDLPVVAANLYDAETDSLIFAPSRIVEMDNGLKIGIVGLMAPKLKLPAAVPPGALRIENPKVAAEREIAALGETPDLIVVLAHMPRGELQRLGKDVPAIDLIVSGHEGRSVRRQRKFGNAYIVQTGAKGRYMGVAVATVDPQNNIIEFNANLVPLSTQWQDHQAIAKLFETYDMEIAREERSKLKQRMSLASQSNESYAGADACQTCHTDIYEQWQGTKHAHAFDILETQNREYDRDCLPCHTTGYYDLAGFASILETPDLVHVQCEMCHGDGSKHAANPDRQNDGRVENNLHAVPHRRANTGLRLRHPLAANRALTSCGGATSIVACVGLGISVDSLRGE